MHGIVVNEDSVALGDAIACHFHIFLHFSRVCLSDKINSKNINIK